MKIAQLSDCHLFADVSATHFGAPVYENLVAVLQAIHADDDIDVIIFTGDLTQDHTKASYLNFVDAVKTSKIDKPFYYLAGNHDDWQLLTDCLPCEIFTASKLIESGTWQVLLCDSKSDTPAGFVNHTEYTQWRQAIKPTKFQLVFMHHHPIDVNYFIDRHGLNDKATFWQQVKGFPTIQAIACGHIHNALEIVDDSGEVTLYTCPATSMQFNKSHDDVSAASTIPGYRTFDLMENGQIHSQVFYVNNKHE
ncbi:metallophosphoesterase [Thalassotalea fusca]